MLVWTHFGLAAVPVLAMGAMEVTGLYIAAGWVKASNPFRKRVSCVISLNYIVQRTAYSVLSNDSAGRLYLAMCAIGCRHLQSIFAYQMPATRGKMLRCPYIPGSTATKGYVV